VPIPSMSRERRSAVPLASRSAPRRAQAPPWSGSAPYRVVAPSSCCRCVWLLCVRDALRQNYTRLIDYKCPFVCT
jgi:hypothetical protein